MNDPALPSQLDMAYRERNQLVAALSKIFPAVLAKHVPAEGEESWDPEWSNIVAVFIPQGQLTWHIHESELDQFGHLTNVGTCFQWDGHSTAEKYERLRGIPADVRLIFRDDTASDAIGRIYSASIALRKCRVCGCTDDDCSGCIERTGQPCHWVEYDLCSACVPAEAAPAPEAEAPAE